MASKQNQPLSKSVLSGPPVILLSNTEGYYFIKLETIVYCIGENAYTTIHFVDSKPLTISKNLKKFELMLVDYGFIRIHQSSLINTSHLIMISKDEGNCLAVMDNGATLDIARQKKSEVLRVIRNLSINST